jgi:hypothetical protein
MIEHMIKQLSMDELTTKFPAANRYLFAVQRRPQSRAAIAKTIVKTL